uniref:Uncharacterized protein n=1 Tax=Arundo donax TaxID=35708 RepID=A0A0A9HEZ4_ARUDO
MIVHILGGQVYQYCCRRYTIVVLHNSTLLPHLC